MTDLPKKLTKKDKEWLDKVVARFRTATETEQKWFLIAMCLCYLDQLDRFRKAKTEQDKETYARDMANFDFVINFFTSNEILDNRAIIINQVKQDYEKIKGIIAESVGVA